MVERSSFDVSALDGGRFWVGLLSVRLLEGSFKRSSCFSFRLIMVVIFRCGMLWALWDESRTTPFFFFFFGIALSPNYSGHSLSFLRSRIN